MLSNSYHTCLFRRVPPSQRSLFSTRPQKQKVDTTDFPPPPKNGNGEWSDWDNDAFVDSDGSELGALFGDDIVAIPQMTIELQEDVAVDAVIKRRVIMEDDDDDIPPPPTGSRGEWDDWSGKGQTFSPSSSPSSSSSSSSSSTWSPRKNDIGNQGKSASENWEGWSEDAPYFDEAEITDDEGNKGHYDDRPVMKSLGSSDLWTRVDRLKMDEPAVVTNVGTADASTSTGASTMFPPPSTAATGPSNMNSDYALTVILEMNRQFASLEAKTTLATENKERKLDVLVAEIADLKRYLGIAFATMGVLIAKDVF